MRMRRFSEKMINYILNILNWRARYRLLARFGEHCRKGGRKNVWFRETLWNDVFWTCRLCCTHELIGMVVTAQVPLTFCRGLGRSLCILISHCGSVGSKWLLGEGSHVPQWCSRLQVIQLNNSLSILMQTTIIKCSGSFKRHEGRFGKRQGFRTSIGMGEWEGGDAIKLYSLLV